MTAPTEKGIRKTKQVVEQVQHAVDTVRIADIHTHLYDPALGELLLWGIDDLLTYHYLVAEVFRYLDLPYEVFWKLSKEEQANLVWDELFVKRTPLSEACRGVVTTLHALGLEARGSQTELQSIRSWFRSQKARTHVDRVLDLAGLESVCMTNSPWDDLERPAWMRGFKRHPRFKAALRIDPLLLDWNQSGLRLREWGYEVSAKPTAKTHREVRRFLSDWTRRMNSGFVMVSLPPDFQYPTDSVTTGLIRECVLPHCREWGQPFAVMPGVRRAVNPGLKLAGDGVELSGLGFVKRLCAEHPQNLFAITALARENQHELCVLARKFRNLHLFGCWWFTNIPSVMAEMTRMRTELLGLSYTPQHSDARVMEQVIYKWKHTRQVIGAVLCEQYSKVAAVGWIPTESEIRRDVQALMGGEFRRFSQLNLPG